MAQRPSEVPVRLRRKRFTQQVNQPPCAASVYCGNIQIVADFTRVVGFQWDEGNARKSFDKHSVSQAEAEQVFFNEPLLVVEDVKHSRLEPRFHALGVTNSGLQLHVTFTLRGENTKIRVVSVRDYA